jgi:hypothetical protein
MDPFGLINIRIESYMGLLMPIRTETSAITDGLHVNLDDFDLGGESVGALGGNGGMARRDARGSEPAELQINENWRTTRDTRGSCSTLRRTRLRQQHPRANPTRCSFRVAGHRSSVFHVEHGSRPKEGLGLASATGHRRPPMPTFCRARGWLQPAAVASLHPSPNR